jgi:hypothetical protein
MKVTGLKSGRAGWCQVSQIQSSAGPSAPCGREFWDSGVGGGMRTVRREEWSIFVASKKSSVAAEKDCVKEKNQRR